MTLTGQGMIEHFKKCNGPFIIFDFAVQSKTYADKIQFDSKSAEKFKDVVQQTKLRMESE